MLHLMGPWAGSIAGAPVALRGQKAKALLTYLAVEGERIGRAHLLGLLWPEMREADARNNLRVSWAQLRRVIQKSGGSEDLLDGNRRELWINASDHIWLDIAEFQRLLDACDQHLHQSRATCVACLERLARAAKLYRGEFLQGFYVEGCPEFDEWLFVRREGWHLEMMALLAELSDYHEGNREYEASEQYTRRQLELDGLREDAHRRLMRLLALKGQRPAALAQFERCRQILEQELGVQPDHETAWLREQIQANRPLIEANGRFAQTSAPSSGNLPIIMTPFIGREQDIRNLTDRLVARTYRLITILGPGGIGKTRLAIEVAQQQGQLFADGAFFVSLAELSAPAEIPSALLSVLGVHVASGQDSPLTHLKQYLHTKQMLIIMDNLEHLMAGSELLIDLLKAAPQLVMLVTSREEIPVQSADLFRLRGMAFPATTDDPRAAQYESVRLFADRAKRINKTLHLDKTVLSAVVRICQLVEGLPLALELAASAAREIHVS